MLALLHAQRSRSEWTQPLFTEVFSAGIPASGGGLTCIAAHTSQTQYAIENVTELSSAAAYVSMNLKIAVVPKKSLTGKESKAMNMSSTFSSPRFNFLSAWNIWTIFLKYRVASA